MAQSRRHERSRSSRSQHSNPGDASCRSSASVALMLAAASIKVMDALFGLVARNDAECCKRELLGRSWRRDWAMRKFRPKNVFWRRHQTNGGIDSLGKGLSVSGTQRIGIARELPRCFHFSRGSQDWGGFGGQRAAFECNCA